MVNPSLYPKAMVSEMTNTDYLVRKVFTHLNQLKIWDDKRLKKHGIVISTDATYMDVPVQEKKNGQVTGILKGSELKKPSKQLRALQDKKIRTLFVFMGTPLNPELHEFPLFSMFSTKDQFSHLQSTAFNTILDYFKSKKIRVHAVSFDAASTNVAKFLSQYWHNYQISVLLSERGVSYRNQLGRVIKSVDVLPCPDPLHILKRIRSRLLKTHVCLTTTGREI